MQPVYALRKYWRLVDEERQPDIECLFYGDIKDIETPEQFILRQEEASLLYQAIDRLDARLARVVRLRMEGLTLDEVGEQFGVTRERIRQMHCKAERKLRKYLKRDFKDRYLALAKRMGWGWAEPSAQEKVWTAEAERREEGLAYLEARRAERAEAERLANLKAAELSRLEVERIRAQNARRYSPPMVSLYVPRLLDPQTGAWEWVKVGRREMNDTSAA